MCHEIQPRHEYYEKECERESERKKLVKELTLGLCCIFNIKLDYAIIGSGVSALECFAESFIENFDWKLNYNIR